MWTQFRNDGNVPMQQVARVIYTVTFYLVNQSSLGLHWLLCFDVIQPQRHAASFLLQGQMISRTSESLVSVPGSPAPEHKHTERAWEREALAVSGNQAYDP